MTRILLVEDDAEDALLMHTTLFRTSSLDAAAYQMSTCDRLADALEVLGREPPDVLLLDLHLPDSTGLETLRAAVQAAPSVPVLVMTSMDDESLATEAIQIGAQDYLVKGRETLDRGAVLRGIRRAIDRHQLQASLRQASADARNTESELRRALTEQNRLEEELRHARRLEAIGRLASGVAHDFNNQLTVVLSCVSMLKDQLDSDSPLVEDVDEIRGAAHRAAGMTRQLLAFGRKQLLRPCEFDVNVIVERMVGMLERLIGDQIRLSLVLGANLDRVYADPAQIEQVLVNLLMNANAAMPNGGQATIRTWQTNGESDQPGADGGSDGYVILTVEDSGVGMDDAVMSRIFEPFFSTRGMAEASGLGLSTVYGIVKQSGGDVRVQSTLGKGSVFDVLLPRVVAERPKSVPPMAKGGATGGQTILLVEDEPAVRRSAERLLRRRGYTVIGAADARAAIELCADTEFDLLLTDVMMPDMMGTDLAARILELRSDIKVLFMSGYSESELAPDGQLMAGAAFVEKPYTPNELVAGVRQLLG